jgi:hypothetical protein
MNWTGKFNGIMIVDVFAIVSCFLVVAKPELRRFRIFAFLAFTQIVSISHMNDKLGAGSYAPLWIFLLLCLPRNWRASSPGRTQTYELIRTFTFCQTMIAFFYFVAGITKVLKSFISFFNGELSYFSIDAFSRICAWHFITRNTDTLLGSILIQFPLLSFPALWAGVTLELAAIWILFRPNLHRTWGLLMLLFHLVSVITLSPSFPYNAILFCLFFVFSPFATLKAKPTAQ